MDEVALLIEKFNSAKILFEEFSLPVVFPMHPRTRKMVREFRLSLNGVEIISFYQLTQRMSFVEKWVKRFLNFG